MNYNYDPNNPPNNNLIRPPIKRVIKPLSPEEQLQNSNQNELELSTVIFRLKRNAEIEPSKILDIDQMSVPNICKKPQHHHIRDSEELHKEHAKEENYKVPSIAEELENNEKNYRLVLKKFDPASIFEEDEESFRKKYKTYYNDQNNKLKRENILKQKRRVLLDNPHNVEILNMSVREGMASHSNEKQLELVSCMEIEKDKQLKEELEKEEYDCYFLERVPDNEIEDAPKIMFNDLTKAVIDNHLNKKFPESNENNHEKDSSNVQNLYPSLESNFLNENKSHLISTNFNIGNQPFRAHPQENQHNERLHKAGGDYHHQQNENWGSHSSIYGHHEHTKEEPKHDNYYAPSIDQLSSHRSIAGLNNERQASLSPLRSPERSGIENSQELEPGPEEEDQEKEDSKLKGPYGIFFILQIAFILMSLRSFKIGYFSFPLVPACLAMLGVGILLIIFGHKSNRITMFLAMYGLYFIWLVMFFKNMRLVMFAAAMISGGVCGLIGMFFVVLFKKRFADFIGFISGTLVSMLFLMGRKKFHHGKELYVLIVAGFFGGAVGMLLMRFLNKKRKVVFSTTLLGIVLMNVAMNILANNYFVWEYALKPSKSHVWIFIFGILRQINFSSFLKKIR